jgi:archaellum component FlaC
MDDPGQPRPAEILAALNNFRDAVADEFARVAEQFASVDDRFARIDDRFDRVDRRLVRLDDRMAGVEDGLGTLSLRIAKMERRRKR